MPVLPVNTTLVNESLSVLLLPHHPLLHQVAPPVHGPSPVQQALPAQHHGIFPVLNHTLVIVSPDHHQVITTVGPDLQIIPVDSGIRCSGRLILSMCEDHAT